MPVRVPTILEVARKRAGMWRGANVVAFMAMWALCKGDLGHEPTVEEYAQWAVTSKRTAYRDQERFRECFPGETTPSRLVEATISEWGADMKSRPSPYRVGAASFPG